MRPRAHILIHHEVLLLIMTDPKQTTEGPQNTLQLLRHLVGGVREEMEKEYTIKIKR